MTAKQSIRTADIIDSDNCCSKCRRDLSGCLAIFKTLVGPKGKAATTADCDKDTAPDRSSVASGEQRLEGCRFDSGGISRELPEGREFERLSKKPGVDAETTEAHFDINGWLNMNRAEVVT